MQDPKLKHDSQDSIVDWNAVLRQIPGSEDPQGPVQLIRSGLEISHDLDPYDQIEKKLDLFLQDLQARFQDLSR